jgi:hypothetical protein
MSRLGYMLCLWLAIGLVAHLVGCQEQQRGVEVKSQTLVDQDGINRVHLMKNEIPGGGTMVIKRFTRLVWEKKVNGKWVIHKQITRNDCARANPRFAAIIELGLFDPDNESVVVRDKYELNDHDTPTPPLHTNAWTEWSFRTQRIVQHHSSSPRNFEPMPNLR